MTRPTRQFALLVLIIVMISFGAAGVHAATHASMDLQTCDQCSTQGNPAFAIPPMLPQHPPPLAVALERPGIILAAHSLDRPAWRSRAPPRRS
ncbi:MAG: hypothetical protein WBM54_07710 [Woeseia sp.]